MSSSPITPPAPYDGLAQGMRRLLLSEGPLPDFIIAVEGQEWPVHKLVLFCHSDVLYKMSTNTAFTECQTGRVVLNGFEPQWVEAMIHFLYHQEYLSFWGCTRSDNEEEWSSEASEDNSDAGLVDSATFSNESEDAGIRSGSRSPGQGGVMNPEENDEDDDQSAAESQQGCVKMDCRLDYDLGVCILADRYNIEGLKLAAESEIEGHLRYSTYPRLSFTVDKILDSDAPESLRKKIISLLAHQPELLHSAGSESILSRRPELAVAILKKVAERSYAKHFDF